MGNPRKPRKGSMQFWHRSQTKRHTARIRFWAHSKDAKLLGFAGYKVGMTHMIITDNRKTTLTKGEGIFCPATVIECPPLKVASIKFYKHYFDGLKVISEIFADNLDKELERSIIMPKKIKAKIDDIKNFDDVKLLVYTQPKLTGIGKKKPEIFEMSIGGKKEEKLNYARNVLGKEILLKDILKEGQQLDVHAITKAKGFQGPVKRFRVALRSHKSEKTKRGPGSLGGWRAQGHVMYRVAHAGRMGYHQRTEYNKQLIKIGSKPEEINPKGGFTHYGIVRNSYLIIKGSIGGSIKRMVKVTLPTRPNHKIPTEAPVIQYISVKSG